ncbi:MAG TPA: AzlC family ABC transporter permease [Ktedonobacterales bacterium]|nr:AzlC family ABC transporter permease [Ktedonobacterales bacterium]
MDTHLHSHARSSALLDGARATLPLLGGTVPFGLIYGVAAHGAHVPAWLAQAMSAVIFAGSAQFAVVQLVGLGAPAAALVLTGTILNLRHLLYSASFAPIMRRRSGRWKAALAYLLTDEMFGVAIARLRAGLPEERQPWYALGSGTTLWVCWQASTLAGLAIGGQIPSGWSLDFAATLTFIALVVPMARDRASVWSALLAGAVAVVALHAPLRLGLVAAALVGVLAGLAAERRPRTSRKPPSAAEATSSATLAKERPASPKRLP